MSCEDCNNLTNGTCCHEVRRRTEVVGDELSIKREFEKVQRDKERRKNEQRA